MNMIKIMKQLMMFLLLISELPALAKSIYIFGDSHASFCFREGSFLQKFESFELPFTINKKSYKLPFKIYWLGPITMHRVGRDGLTFLNVKNYKVQDNDIAVFVFGEIDVRCHIGKQRDLKKRGLGEIINNLAENYITTIKENQKMFNELTCVVACIAPPIDGIGRMNLEYPFYGYLSDRIQIARMLNKKIQLLCALSGFLFLDFYDLYADSQGALDLKFADPTVHIDAIYNKPIKMKLIELIMRLL